MSYIAFEKIVLGSLYSFGGDRIRGLLQSSFSTIVYIFKILHFTRNDTGHQNHRRPNYPLSFRQDAISSVGGLHSLVARTLRLLIHFTRRRGLICLRKIISTFW